MYVDLDDGDENDDDYEEENGDNHNESYSTCGKKKCKCLKKM